MPQPHGPSSHDFERRGGSESRETKQSGIMSVIIRATPSGGGGGAVGRGGGEGSKASSNLQI